MSHRSLDDGVASHHLRSEWRRGDRGDSHCLRARMDSSTTALPVGHGNGHGSICQVGLTNQNPRPILKMESELDMGEKISNRIKELRSERAWTQQELATAVGVSRQSINSIERNRYVPSLPLALKFAEVFDCPTDAIFTLEAQR